MMLDIKNKEIAIIGCGETGYSVSKLLKQLGASPFVFDQSSDTELSRKAEILLDLGIPTSFGGYSFELLKDYDMILLSPGVDPTKSPIPELKKEKIPVLGDIELIYHISGKPFIAITGTNGKTTTTRLIASIMEKDGKKIVSGGNMPGASLAAQWDRILKSDMIVCEISSFQLEGIADFKPHVAGYLNISPDHIDRYPDFTAYFEAKNRIYENMSSEDSLVLNYEDELLRNIESGIKAKVYHFSTRRSVERGSFCSKDKLIFRDDDKEEELFSKSAIPLQGKHNLENVLAAVTVTSVLNTKKASQESAVSDFKLSDHTLEFVTQIDGVKFINDSKGTNVDSVIRALESFSEPIILLAGGKDKGCDYEKLSPYLEKKVKKLILFGEAKERIESAVQVGSNLLKVVKMADAVRLAFEVSSPGDLVLLSPACSSFDEFENYAQRGEAFKETVMSLMRA